MFHIEKVILVIIALLFVLSGCFQMNSTPSAPPTSKGSSSVFSNVGPVGAATELPANVVYEGRRYEYIPDVSKEPELKGATFEVKNKPDWAVFNSTTGTLSGIAKAGSYGGVEIIATSKSSSKTFGPLDLSPASDPLKENEWYIENTGQSAFSKSGGVAGEDLKVKNVIEMGYTGKGVRVAISDDGLEIAHEDLTMNVAAADCKNYSSTGGPTDPTPVSPDEGHGTAVSGLISAQAWNGKGGRGIAPDSKIAGYNFLSGSNATTPNLLDQIQRPIDNKMDVLNQSWGSIFGDVTKISYLPIDTPSNTRAYVDILSKGVRSGRSGKGLLYVRSAGNSYVENLANPGQPAVLCRFPSMFDEFNNYPYTMVIGAMNANGVKSSYSSVGSNLWISGLGGEFGSSSPAMVSSDLTGCDRGFAISTSTVNTFETGASGNTNCKYTSRMNGTSSASPTIAGVMALMLQARPGLSWRDVKHILAKTAVKVHVNYLPPTIAANPVGYVSEPGWITNAAGFNFHNWYGFGRADALAAVEMAKIYESNLGTLKETLDESGAWKYSSGTLSLPINDNNVSAPTGVHSITVSDRLTIESVQIKLSVAHSYTGELGVELISPSGTKSVVIAMNNCLNTANFDDIVLLSNAFYGEPSNGNWTIRVLDGRSVAPTPTTPGNNTGGTLTNWKIHFLGH